MVEAQIGLAQAAKIVERSAELGERYVAGRFRKEFIVGHSQPAAGFKRNGRFRSCTRRATVTRACETQQVLGRESAIGTVQPAMRLRFVWASVLPWVIAGSLQATSPTVADDGPLQHGVRKIAGMAAPTDVEFIARADGSRQRYLEFRPFPYPTNKAPSLMIFLHGHGSDRWQITKGDQWREIQAVCDVAARHAMILISPDYRATTSWMGPAAETDLLQIVEEQKAKRPIRHVFLAGGSMGGTSVLIFTALHPEQVNGVISMNGTANLMEFDGFADAIAASYGGRKSERPDVYKQRSPEFVPERFASLAIAFTAGAKDTVVPPHSVLRLSRELQRRYPGHVLLLYREQGGHSTSYDDAVAALEFVIERAGPTSRSGAGN